MMSLRLIFTLGLLMFLGSLSGQVNPDSIPAPYEDEVVIIDDRQTIAHFPGGDDELVKYLKKTLKYPKKAADAKISGTVMVQFTIAKDGSITSVSLFSGVHPLLDSVALEAVKSMPDWIPGTWSLKPTTQSFILPIMFDCSKKEKKGFRQWLKQKFKREISGVESKMVTPIFSQDSEPPKIHVPENPAQFPGGEDSLIAFINRTIIYPEEAKNERFSGTVWVLFTVEKDGQITNGEIKFSVHPCLDEEALRIVYVMPRWIPATQNGKMVRSFYLLLIRFDLQEQKF